LCVVQQRPALHSRDGFLGSDTQRIRNGYATDTRNAPAAPNIESTMNVDRPQLTKLSPLALERIQKFHPQIVREVAEAVAKNAVVVVGMDQNPVVKRARALLSEASVPYTYLAYGSYFSQWKQRLAIKLWSGWPTFPQVFVQGELVGGASELETLLKDGSLKAKL
jgi:monothiol glutaredoxin